MVRTSTPARSAEQLDRTFFALSDPTRRGMLLRLASGERSVADLASPFDLAPATISKHLKVLEQAGLVLRRRDGRELLNRLNPSALDHGLGWMSEVASLWSSQFAKLDRLLARRSGSERS